MGSLERKLARRQLKDRQKNVKKMIRSQLGLFGLIPEECSGCGAFFDKTNREQVVSWKARVREAPKDVQIYCPACEAQSGKG